MTQVNQDKVDIEQRARAVRMIVFDVDGVLTDGSLFYDNQGQEYKAFNSRDGHGIKMLRASGVETGIITGRTSQIVLYRARNLGIGHIYQGAEDKLEAFQNLLQATGLTPQKIAYMGDDVVDLPVINRCGLAITVPDAPDEVKARSHVITLASAGRGAAREACELIMRAQGTWAGQIALYDRSSVPPLNFLETGNMSLGYHVHWPPLVLALLLALLGFWLNHVSDQVPYVDDAGFAHEPDYIVERFNALAFDLQGRPRHRLVAERMTHYMDDDTTVLEQPVFTSLDPQVPVEVKSKRAQMSADGKQVYFLNQVHVVRHGMNGQMPTTLDTEYLHVTPDDRIMRTNKFVTLRQGSTVITANQMLVDDNNKLLSLSGGVKGIH